MSQFQSIKYMELSSKLREIFQINRPELDFGIYRILNARSREIGEYLDRTLPEKVRAALSSGDATLTKQLQAELKDAEKSAQSLGLNPDVAPRVLELRAKLREGGASGAEHENAVFSHLLTFFSRYYDKGDFVSLRRYKGDTYSIPYSGEEVLLHWANKDQYYIKSGENFSNYSFSLEDGRRVHFRVLAADVAKDNRKDNDRDRCFVLAEKRVHTREDEAGDEIEEQVVPVEEVVNDGSSELIIRFVYATVPKGTRQDALLGESLRAISASDIVQRNWQGLMTPLPTEKNPQRTLLEKHLTDYTAKNTADYFIHKDLGAFLRRELDFYIKNEVLSLDDVQAAEVISDIDKRLRMIQCLRSIALEVIVFLSQLEDYQKRLWMKKKFVVGCHYCMTLDRVPKGLLQSVVSNRKQWDEWRRLGLWRKAGDGTAADLAAQPFMMVDSSLYDLDFVEKLLAGVDDLDEATDGLLIHSDNFQALNLIGERYRSKIDFIYIDPPYNTVHSKIAYKNQFEHSSWLALISNTIPLARRLLAPMYSFGFAIDDYEYNNAFLCLRDQFAGADVATVVIEHHPQGSGGRLSRTHEYYIVISPQNGPQYLGFPEEDETEDRSFMRSGTAENNFRAGRPRSFYALLIDPVTRKVVGVEPPPDRGANYPTGLTAEGLERKYPINEKGEERVWRSSYETGRQRVERGEIELTARGAVKQLIAHQDKRKTLMSTWKGAEFNAGTNGTAVLDNLGLGGVFDYPKSVKTLEQAFWMQSFGKVDFTVLDYFGGSGTTGHATLSLNRKDGKRRKYVLVEQGEYFSTVLKPRMQKVVYSSSWEKGEPVAPESGMSHCFKVLRLESYEDTLNNLELKKSKEQRDLLAQMLPTLQEDYLLRYMLDVESRESLLSLNDFRKPFSRSLNVSVDSAGSFMPCRVDLVETFSYLLGLKVLKVNSHLDEGYVAVSGLMPDGKRTLVLWRDCDRIQHDAVEKLFAELLMQAAGKPYDLVYINGDHNLSPRNATNVESAVGPAQVMQIEPEFMSRMFQEAQL